MEKIEKDIKKFLAVSSGDGYGYGDGDGDGSGDGYGYGDGSGYGSGYGSGSGSGSGYGSGHGSGSGDGSGDGDGYGYGYGSGDGDGDGDGYGYGDGDGDGYGDGDGIAEFNGKKVYQVDGVPTIIDSVHGSYAKGSILNSDFTLTPCYIAKVDNFFAHGETLREAMKAATDKAMENMPLEDRIARFKEQYPDPDVKIPARQLYDWHHTLTGSCEMGRKQFAREHGIDVNVDSFTIREFIKLTCKSYGSEAISELADSYDISM